MQFEIACPSCPLCKRQLSASSGGFTLNTRLCKPCQALVLTAFRGADSAAVSTLAVVQQGRGVAQVQHDSPALDYAFVGSPASCEPIALVAPSFEQETKQPMPPETHDALSFDLFEDQVPDHRRHAGKPDPAIFAGNGSSQLEEEFSSGPVKSVAVAEPEPDLEYAEAENASLAAEPAFIFSTPDTASIGVSLVGDRSEDAPLIGEQTDTDPWAAPLPAWEYSQNEWPVLVGPTKRTSPITTRRVLAAAIILLAGAAGYYFLIYSTSTPPRRTGAHSGTTERVSAVVEPHDSAAKPEEQDALNGAASTPAASPSAAARPAEAVAHEPATSNENSYARGRFSLQAAAFPTQSGAEEFAEKLKRAGVPSYVAPVDLARRGRWFRVRVGRFNAAEDAQRFVGEAQQRARAAGLSLQLIVCQYDQP